MRYLSILLLVAGCSSPTIQELNAEAEAKREAEIIKRCDFMVGPPRDTYVYLTCKEYISDEMKK